MIFKIGSVEHELKTTLGVIYAIEKDLNIKVSSLHEIIQDSDTGRLIRILHKGVADKSVKLADFESEILNNENFSYEDLITELTVFTTLLVSKRKSEQVLRLEIAERREEVEKEILEDMKENEKK